MAETLETQLAEARSRNAQLQGEVEKLNDTVFSKTFRAPSAWAEREVKYKMEKKDWDTQVTCCIPHIYPSAYSSGGRTAFQNVLVLLPSPILELYARRAACQAAASADHISTSQIPSV